MQTTLLSQADIQALVSMDDVIAIVEQTYRGMGEGTVVNPAKLNLDLGETAAWPPYQGFMNAMPAYVGWLDSAGIKWAGGFLGNAAANLPYISGMVLVIDPHNGQFLCVADGASITSLRTGAQTAVACKYLRPAKPIRLGLYGAGAQGRTQTLAISRVFEIERLCVYDTRPEAAERFREDMRATVRGEIVLARSPEQAADADAVISVTPSKAKFIRDAWIKPGTVLFPMGSYQECEDRFILTADRIIVDHVEQCLHRGALRELSMAGRISASSIYATIGELVAGIKAIPAAGVDRVLCIPVGTGAMDVAVATVALRRARERGIGGEFAFV